MVRSAGFELDGQSDVTAEFLGTARAALAAAEELADGLRASMGSAAFDEKQAERRAKVEAIEAGLLGRQLLVGVAPT